MTDAQQTFIPKLLLFLTLLFLMSCEEVTDELGTNSATNTAPVVNAQTLTLNEDTIKTIVLTATDVDGDSLTYHVVTQPSNGVLTGTVPNLTYTPNANYNGTDSFTFKANDGTADSQSETISLTINAVNDAPVGVERKATASEEIIVTEDTPKNIILSATDADGDTLTYIITQNPVNGQLTGLAPNVTYTPNANLSNLKYTTKLLSVSVMMFCFHPSDVV